MPAVDVESELAKLDKQLKRMWSLHTHWLRTGDSRNQNPAEALRAIDDLLEQRHAIVLKRQGECINHDVDVASAEEWGEAG